jgi:hypothetical protein
MNDKIVNITFNIWANSEEEGEELKRELGAFIDHMGQQGRKVTAAKLTEALRKYKNNYFVTQFFP